MPYATDTARLVPLMSRSLPELCDPFLSPPGKGDFFASRVWYDTVLAHALPQGMTPLLALAEEGLLLPLLRDADGALHSLTTPYSLSWKPLLALGAEARPAARALGLSLRGERPLRLDALDAATPGLDEMLAGIRSAGLVPMSFLHFGNWWQPLLKGACWANYLTARPPALRTTIQRKLARAGRESRFELVSQCGAELEAGIQAYEAVRARSWKPWEPFPDFDAALMRASARAGALRLGILRNEEGVAMAAQYWIIWGGQAALLKLAHAEDARAASPGTVLTAKMIQWLIDEDRVAALDFGRGDDAYKPLWVAERRQRIGLILANPLRPAGLMALARQAAGQGRRQALQWIGKAAG
jgi:hypothetical protein